MTIFSTLHFPVMVRICCTLLHSPFYLVNGLKPRRLSGLSSVMIQVGLVLKQTGVNVDD